MYVFPEGFYIDVRIEETFDTKITYKKLELQEQKIRNNKGAFIRLFDGKKWYYSAVSNIDTIQSEIDALAEMAEPNDLILEHPIVGQFEVNRENRISYAEMPIGEVPIQRKRMFLESLLEKIKDDVIVNHSSFYVENRTIKQIFSSKGTNVNFDKQTCGVRISLELAYGDESDRASISKGADCFDTLETFERYFSEEISKSVEFIKTAETIEPGDYMVLMSPMATGVFTHESFGHKSESDFMIGDEAMKAEWTLGKQVASSIVTIVDDGQVKGNGFVPYDDEGTEGKKTMIITDGILTGRLHSTQTAALLEEELTGNARALNFEYEPIVRMTTTYIERGNRPLKDIISEMDRGIYVDTIKHGSGLSTFTMAPARSYLIENGKITKPLKISVITGDVFGTLQEVDAISKEFELLEFVGGGCGKMEQWPLPVGFGGPYTRVRKLKVH